MFQAGSGTTSKVLARGLGVLPMEKQVEELMNWLKQMAEQMEQDFHKRLAAARSEVAEETAAARWVNREPMSQQHNNS